MTVLIGSLAGVTTPAMERLLGPVRPGAARPAEGGPGDFSALLAAVANASSGRGRAPGELAAAEPDAAVEEREEASTTAETAPTADVQRSDRSLDRLDPVFRQRLERVIERMESEHGHSVNIVEAHRSQARQDFLYQQGRTRPGNVVTWTRNSNHTEGRAVDVMIDGTYSNRVGYERLARIAAEEGLNTLGPKDPGHIELARGARGFPRGDVAIAAASGPTLAAAAPTAAPGSNGLGLARVADVARVAEVARVADVARVARPGQPAPLTAPAQETAPALSAAAAPEAPVASAGDRRGSDRSGGDRHAGDDGRPPAEPQPFRADPGAGRMLSSASPVAPSAPGGSDAVQRAAQILALKEGAQAPVSHLTLRLDAPGGGEDRIRVDLRGGTVSTTLSLESASAAERLAIRTPELRHALERHGLDADAVRIRATHAAAAERLDPLRTALAGETDGARQGSQQRSGSEGSGGRDAWKTPHEQQHREQDSRHRSRREQPRRGEA